MKHLIVVDMQNDFMAGGALPATFQTGYILGPMREYIKNFPGVIIFTQDTHDTNFHNTLEGKYLPPHCIKGTKGWEIIDELKPYADEALTIQKNIYGSVKLAHIMRAVNSEEIQICGVCTGICVASNALLLRTMCPNTPIKVISNLCGDVSAKDHHRGLEVMRACLIEEIKI